MFKSIILYIIYILLVKDFLSPISQATTSLNTVLITLRLKRPLPWALVATERNSAGDFHFAKSRALSFSICFNEPTLEKHLFSKSVCPP
jgi:hypothetical protein